ncbi:hypothetical protein K6119_15580 [Paracrocinitomix mangrovi]|uniref:hypothetical protein n=1 Tax=Paracrocinitomix mangrovi TaxID=2862509 RepID=UPI001C8DBADD|nr:hypothetical protein [Paracrocinitomix mangrovi]UKN01150.1 hypothetical protein K6119_15580 [Paracrocinitomix mangrovi]
MKTKIYILEDKLGNGKPRHIKSLIANIQQNYEGVKSTFAPTDLRGDTIHLLTINRVKIGFISHENPQHTVQSLLSYFENKGCHAIFATSVNKNELNNTVANLVVNGIADSVFLKSIWTSELNVELLFEYEISQLMEIVDLHLEAYGTPLNNTKSNDMIQSDFRA